MDWQGIIEHHASALRRVLEGIVAMAGLSDGQTIMPRRWRLAVLRLLRPAEAAARRLIVIAARGLTVPPPLPKRQRKPKPKSIYVRPGRGTGIVVPYGTAMPDARPRRGRLAFVLVDPAYRIPRPRNRAGMPRISSTDWFAPPPTPLRPARLAGERVDATALRLRLAALDFALGDLHGQALRLVRWQARQGSSGRRSSLRPGPAYGLRRLGRPRDRHEVGDILAETHYFARLSASPDTS